MTHDLSTIERLHTRLVDSHDGYETSRERLDEAHWLAEMFARRAEERSRFAADIRTHLARHGRHLDDDGSILAAAHRTWLGLRDTITGGDDEAILDEIVNGETQLLDLYDKAAECVTTDPEWAFLGEQRAAVEAALNEVRTAKARLAA